MAMAAVGKAGGGNADGGGGEVVGGKGGGHESTKVGLGESGAGAATAQCKRADWMLRCSDLAVLAVSDTSRVTTGSSAWCSCVMRLPH
jgi:hypothetical protein